jgi:NAD(P)-dependent dehydrogenase (short-subunit alcohol dehydrogenase family)
MDLNQRVALITGAGSGIGRATAELFGKHNGRVACLSRTEEEVEEVVEAIRAQGGEALPVIADISDADAMQKAFKKTVDEWGRLDILFANAGINGVWAPIDELEPDDIQKTLNVNLFGTLLTIKYAVPYMKKQGGSILITSSVNGTRVFSNTGATVYSATKAGQVAIMKMLALELAPAKIRVNAICPGAIDTNIEENMEQRDLGDAGVEVEFPEGRIPLTGGESGTSEQVAKLALFLASDASDHISGTELWIDGAESLLQG